MASPTERMNGGKDMKLATKPANRNEKKTTKSHLQD